MKIDLTFRGWLKTILLVAIVLFANAYYSAPLSANTVVSVDGQFDAKTSKEIASIAEHVKKQEYAVAQKKVETLLKDYSTIPKLHLIKANIMSLLEGDQKALNYLTTIISKQPENIGLYAARAQFLLTKGFVESAREDFYYVYQNGHRPVDVLKVLAEIEEGKGNFVKAIKLLQQALEIEPDKDDLWFKRAELELKLVQIKQAKNSCKKAIQLAPEKIKYHKLYVEILIYLKQREELEQHIREAHALFPTDSWISLRMSSLLVEQGDLKGAVEVLAQSLKKNPKNHLLMFQIATILAGDRKWDEAIKFFKSGLEIEPDSAWAQIQLAKVYLQNGNANLAIEYLEKARLTETRDPFVYETLARIYNRKNDTFEAERVILEGLSINEKNQTLILEYANLLEKRGKVKETIKAYEESLKYNPNNAYALGKLGNLYRIEEEYESSLKSLTKAIYINPKATWIRAYYVETLDDMERWDEALLELEKLLKIMPNDYWAYAKRSLIELELGKLEAALKSVNKSSKLRPDAEWLKEIEGRILEKLKNYDQAEKAFLEAAKRSPDRVHIQTRLAYVQLHLNKANSLQTVKNAIDADDFDLSTIELYLFLRGDAENYWGFEKNSREYEVYKNIIFKDFAEAEKGLKKLTKEKNQHTPFFRYLLNHMKQEKKEDQSLVELAEKDFISPWHFYYRGIQAIRDDDYRLAEQSFSKGLGISPDNPWMMIKLSYAHQQLKQYESAVHLLNRFLQIENEGEYMWVLLRLALNYDLAKKFPDSERVYKKILAKNPEDNVALNNLAWMYLNATDESMHKLDDALKLALKAVEIRPSSANLDTLAEAYFQKKAYSKALKTIERALDKDRLGLDDFKKTKKKILRAMEAEQNQ